MKVMEEDKLIRLAKGGSETATEELMKNYRESVNRISRSFFIVGGDMEDIVQEGLIGLYKAIRNYNPDREASFKTFAHLCIKHQIQDLIKRAGSLKNRILSESLPLSSTPDDDDEGFYVVLPSDCSSPETELIAREEIVEFQEKILTVLSAMEKKILSLYLKGYSYEEIAAHIGGSKKNVDNALTRVKAKLAKLQK